MNFGTIYLITPWGMRRNWGIPLETGKEFLRNYFKGYPVLNIFLKKLGDMVCENYYSTTLLGRKRFFEKQQFYVDHIEREKDMSSMRREGVNHSVQGGSADIVKIAMKDIFYDNLWEHDDMRILLQEHDEIVVEAENSIAGDVATFVKVRMENAEKPFLGDIPAKVDVIIRDHWSKG
jgi:DNA polymerase I-like protein with 3'-5' exonuclease and polymerase domains